MPNTFAFLMLFSWPLVAFFLFRVLPLHKALIWTVLAGYLLLPSATSVELPMLPALDKALMPTASALLLCLIYAPRRTYAEASASAASPAKGGGLVYGILALLLLSPVVTALQNPEPIIIGPRFIQGLVFYDALSMVSSVLVSILPFFLGWRYLNTRDSHVYLLKAFVFGTMAYSLPVLFELRMSPQLHNWIYGFFPHSFVQHIRADGFRPVVFLSHGLLVGMLFSLAILAALTLWRDALREGKTSSGWIFAIVWLAGVLSFSKNLGALGITILLGLLITFAGRRLQVLVAVVIGAIVMLYPMLRGADLVPVETVYNIALSIDEERAESLKFRFDNEDALLAHANLKPWFGWGSWGRNQLYEAEQGKVISVTDGLWVILIGVYGWMGYVAHFGLLTVPIFLYSRRKAELGPSLITPGLMILLSASLIDLLPNAGLVPYVWLVAGAITGFALRRTASETDPEPHLATEETSHGWRTGGIQPAPWVMKGMGSPHPQSTLSRTRRRQSK